MDASSSSSKKETSSSSSKPRPRKRDDFQVDYVWENQRGTAMLGAPRFSAKSLLPTDRGAWSDEVGKFSLSKESMQLPDPEKWKWSSPWMVDMTLECDPEGWQYAFNFGHFRWSSVPSFSTYVRRRRWKRIRQRTWVHPSSSSSSSSSSSASSSSSEAPHTPHLKSLSSTSSPSFHTLPPSLSLPSSSGAGNPSYPTTSPTQLLPHPSTSRTPPLIALYRKKLVRLDRERLELLASEVEDKDPVPTWVEVLGTDPESAMVEVLNLFDYEVSKRFAMHMLMQAFPKESEWMVKLGEPLFLFHTDRMDLRQLKDRCMASTTTTTTTTEVSPTPPQGA